MTQLHFPGDSAEYRTARDELLRAEIDLRRQTENVARMRRELPLGGKVPEDYDFETMDGRRVCLSELFRDGKSSLVVYSFMYGPNMARPCPSCTSILDALDAETKHIVQRANFVVVAKSPAERIRTFATERGWRSLELLSSADNSYNRDYYGENEKGDQWPMLNVFTQREDGIHHTYASELFGTADSGQDDRHVDPIWPLWNILDYTPEGRGAPGIPKLTYDK
jgi:predicted dithiol-disulfide oxidoreductase (DUF899 family)